MINDIPVPVNAGNNYPTPLMAQMYLLPLNIKTSAKKAVESVKCFAQLTHDIFKFFADMLGLMLVSYNHVKMRGYALRIKQGIQYKTKGGHKI